MNGPRVDPHIRIKTIGGEEIRQRIGALDVRAKALVKDVLSTSALNIQNRARILCPVRKSGKQIGGRLRASIRTEFFKNGLAAEIGTNVEYAMFVEFGTGRRGAQMSLFGAPHLPTGYVHGPKAGMHAQPYLWPAFEEERPNFQRNLAQALLRGLGR